MKKTVLYDEHKKLGGNIVDFAGWQLPVMYTSIIEEHNATRTKAGIFDICHMGEFRIKGKEAKKLLEKIIPTRLDKIETGKAMYSCLLNENAGIIDDIFVFMINENEYYIVVNASNIETDLNWISKNNIFDADVTDESDDTAKIDIQGPESFNIMKNIIKDEKLSALKRFHFAYTEYNGERLMISNTGYTGEKGYELFIDKSKASQLWNELLEKGKNFGLLPCGLGARDSLRIEACYSLYGHELSLNINPYEAGIGWIVSSSTDYIGKTALLKEKAAGIKREVIALETIERGIPRSECRIILNGDIGYVTSGVFSPTFKKGIALALVEKNRAKSGDTATIAIRDKIVLSQVVERPFYKFNG